MLLRPRIGRRIVRTAAVGGAAYMVGSHAATKSMQEQQQEAAQNAQIAELQRQAALAQTQAATHNNDPTRDAIYQQIMEKGWNAKRGAFIQHYQLDHGAGSVDLSGLISQ